MVSAEQDFPLEEQEKHTHHTLVVQHVDAAAPLRVGSPPAGTAIPVGPPADAAAFAVLFDALLHPALVVDADGHVLFCNAAALRCCLKPPPVGIAPTLHDNYPDYAFLLPAIRTSLAEQRTVTHENVLVQARKSAAYRMVTVTPTLFRQSPATLVCLLETGKAHLAVEDLLVQAQKSTFVSAFAAGMAHEVNSPLSVVFQSTQNILRRLDPSLEQNKRAAAACGCDLQAVTTYLRERGIMDTLETLRRSAERVTTLMGTMLGFSRRRGPKRSTVHICELVTRCLDLIKLDTGLQPAFAEGVVTLTQEYESYLPMLICHSTEIEQAIINLIKNAVQAMTADKLGDNPKILGIRAWSEGSTLCLAVSDTGPGMSLDMQATMFEPFVTTKNIGAGTGLGLFIARHIVEVRHKGSVRVASEEGKGSTFTLLLPFTPH